MFHSRRQAVVGHDDANAPAGQIFPDAGVKSATAIVAHHPGAAVDEHDDREILLPPGQIQIETVARGICLRSVAIDDVARLLHLASAHGRRFHGVPKANGRQRLTTRQPDEGDGEQQYA